MQIAIAMSLVMFSQTIGGAVFLTIANTIFTQSLATELPKYAPDVDPQVIVNAGATAIRSVVSPKDLGGVLIAFSKAFDHIFYLNAAAGVACFVFAWGMGWKDIRQKKQVGQA